MKIIFAGTPEFAAIALAALFTSSHQMIAVYTQPDKPAGRGLKLTHSPVKKLASAHHLPIYQPATLKNNHEQTFLAQLNADVMVVAAYGLLLPKEVLSIPRLGCINIHPSLLPRWRGAAPIQHTILAGDEITGVSIMQMDEGLDTGPILLQQSYALRDDETAKSLHDQLAKLGAEVLIETLNRLNNHDIIPIPQNNELATYANKISKEEAHLNWAESAIHLERKVRAFNPTPIAYTKWQQQTLRIFEAKALALSHHYSPGTIISASHEGVDIATHEGALRLLRVQLPGGKVLAIHDFYNARRNQLPPGDLFT